MLGIASRKRPRLFSPSCCSQQVLKGSETSRKVRLLRAPFRKAIHLIADKLGGPRPTYLNCSMLDE